MDRGVWWRGALVVLCLAGSGCARKPDAIYVRAMSPDGRSSATLLQRYNRLGLSSEFVFAVSGPGLYRSLPVVGTRELEWRTAFAVICWSPDSRQVAYLMSNFWEPRVIQNAFDLTSAQPAPFNPFVPIVRLQVEAKWGPFLTPGVDAYEQARRPSQKLISEFTRRVETANGM